jgi:hypothetical protein
LTTAKQVQISADGVAYYTLPGNTGEFNDEGEQIDDTIFGHTFSSTQPGLISWTCNAQAFYKGFAGYVASIKSSGTPVASTGNAMTLVSGKTYKITDATKNVWDYTAALVVNDNAVLVTENNYSVNWLFGQVTFVDSYTVNGPVTVDVSYMPVTEVSKANSFTLTQTAATVDHTDYQTAHANDGYRVYRPGLRTVSLELGGFYDSADAVWEILEGRTSAVMEINPDGSGMSLARGIFKLVTRNQSGDVGALETQTRTFNLSVPEGMDIIFNWIHDAGTTLSQAIRVALDSYIDQTLCFVRYMPDGFDDIAFFGEAVLTDVSLSSSLDAMNEFTANFQGSDRPTRAVISD